MSQAEDSYPRSLDPDIARRHGIDRMRRMVRKRVEELAGELGEKAPRLRELERVLREYRKRCERAYFEMGVRGRG